MRRSRGLLSGAQILTADPPAIHGADTFWMLGRAGEDGASMHSLDIRWVVSGAATMYRRAHAASTRVTAAAMHLKVIILVNWVSYGWKTSSLYSVSMAPTPKFPIPVSKASALGKVQSRRSK
jgi:hypothetical protein